MTKSREFIIKNYYGFGGNKFPWFDFKTKKFKWVYPSYFKGSPKVYLTFVLYGILKISFNSIFFTWWLDIPMLLAIIVQLSLFTPFYGITYFDKHPLTPEEQEFLNKLNDGKN